MLRKNKNFFIGAVILLLLVTILKEQILEPVGEFIFPPLPILGFLALYITLYFLITDYIKFKKPRENTVFLIISVIVLFLMERVDVFTWIENLVLEYVPTKYPVEIGLLISLIILYLIYYLKYKRRKNE